MVPNTLVLGPNKERIYPTASLHVQKIHSPLSLHYGLFGQGGDLLRQLNHVFKDTPIPLLPHIPHDVYSFLKFHMTYIAALLVSGSHHSTKEAGSCCGHCTKKKKDRYTQHNGPGLANLSFVDYSPLEFCCTEDLGVDFALIFCTRLPDESMLGFSM